MAFGRDFWRLAHFVVPRVRDVESMEMGVSSECEVADILPGGWSYPEAVRTTTMDALYVGLKWPLSFLS